MHYKELFEKHKLFKDYDDKWYDVSRQKTDWQNLQNLTIEQVKNEVIWFVNKWGCRIGPERRLDIIAKGIKGRYVEVASLLEVLDSETLEEIDLEQNKKVGHKQIGNSRIIHDVFSMFSNIGYRFRWTATSKVLHMINPKLFVMWDNAICDGYFFAPSASSYAYRFMPLMKQEANEAITTYMKVRNCNRNTAIKEIMLKCDGRTIAKLIDEYNWIKYTKKLDC